MSLDEVVIAKVEGNRSLKVFKLLTERIRQSCEAAAMHSQRVILFLNMAGRNAVHVGQAVDNGLFRFDHSAGL